MPNKKWSERSRWSFSLRTSLALHAALIVIFFGVLWIFTRHEEATSSSYRVSTSAHIRSQPLPENSIDDSHEDNETSIQNVRPDATSLSSENALDPRWEQVVQADDAMKSDNAPTVVNVASDSSDEQPDPAASLVAKQVTRSIKNAKGSSDSENFEKLTRLSKQLSDKSNEANVDAMNKTLNRMLGASKRAIAPAKPIVGHEFDVATAQLHEIEKRVQENGKTAYLLTMLDASGQTTQITLTAEEGEQIYRVMQIVKANPLLEQLYRGVVMSLLDDLLKTSTIKPQSVRQPNVDSSDADLMHTDIADPDAIKAPAESPKSLVE